MFGRMPVSSEDDTIEEGLALFERVDVFEYLIAFRHSERSPFTEIVLHIDDYQNS